MGQRERLEFPGWVYVIIAVCAVLAVASECASERACNARGGVLIRQPMADVCVSVQP